MGIIQKAGAWFSYNGEKIGQGSENAKKFLAENPAIFDEIDHKVRVQFGLVEDTETTSPAATEETTPATDDLILDLDGGIELDD